MSRTRVEAVPAVIACVAIAFAVLAAERKLAPPAGSTSQERRAEPLLAPAPLAPTFAGDRK